jgi:uncharacterized protein YxeA
MMMKKYVLFIVLILVTILMAACSNEKEDLQTKEPSTQQEDQEDATPAKNDNKEEVVQKDKEAQAVVGKEKSCAYLKFNDKELQIVFIRQELNQIENGRYLTDTIEYQTNRMNPEIVCQMVEKINSLSDTFVESNGGTGVKDNGSHDNRTIVIHSMDPNDLFNAYNLEVSIKKDPLIFRHFVYSSGSPGDWEETSYDFDEAKLDELLKFLSTIEPTFKGIK